MFFSGFYFLNQNIYPIKKSGKNEFTPNIIQNFRKITPNLKQKNSNFTPNLKH